MTQQLSREVPVEPGQTTLLFIDVQNYCAHRQGGEYKDLKPDEFERRLGYYFRQLETVAVPNMQRLQAGCSKAGIEVMYTTIENLTKDGRDRSLDYKITGFSVPPGSWDAQVIDAIKPGDDEIVLPKTSSSVFISTNIDYLLRNLGVRSLMIAGLLTDQCIDSAVRDACATYTRERHDFTLRAIKGYCRQRTTQEFLREIGAG